jgi:hypothetical protein
LQELENQVFQNEVKEQEVCHPCDTDLFDITKRDPDYHKLLPFLVSLCPIIVDSSKHCGYACTFNILTSDSPTSIYQSLVPPDSPDEYTFCPSMFGGENAIHNAINNDDDNHNHHPMVKFQSVFDIVDESKPADTPIFNPETFNGLSFLMNNQEHGQQFCGRDVQIIGYHELLFNNNPTKIKFLVSINKYQAEVIITFNEMLEYISKDEKTETMGNFYEKYISPGSNAVKPSRKQWVSIVGCE